MTITRPLGAMRLLLGVGAALCLAAFIRSLAGACGACAVGSPPMLPLAGSLFYGALLGVSLAAGPAPIVSIGIAVAAAVHGALVAHLVSHGAFCLLCFAAAANAVALLVLSFICDGGALPRFSIVFPVASIVAVFALPFVGITPAPPVARPTEDVETALARGVVRVDVFEKPDCPYCVELRETLIPKLRRDFGDVVEIAFREAHELPGIRVTPTIIVAGAEVIEGLPPYGMLREAVERRRSSK